MHSLLEHRRAGILFAAGSQDQGLLPALRDVRPLQWQRLLARQCNAVPCVRNLKACSSLPQPSLFRCLRNLTLRPPSPLVRHAGRKRDGIFSPERAWRILALRVFF